MIANPDYEKPKRGGGSSSASSSKASNKEHKSRDKKDKPSKDSSLPSSSRESRPRAAALPAVKKVVVSDDEGQQADGAAASGADSGDESVDGKVSDDDDTDSDHEKRKKAQAAHKRKLGSSKTDSKHTPMKKQRSSSAKPQLQKVTKKTTPKGIKQCDLTEDEDLLNTEFVSIFCAYPTLNLYVVPVFAASAFAEPLPRRHEVACGLACRSFAPNLQGVPVAAAWGRASRRADHGGDSESLCVAQSGRSWRHQERVQNRYA